MKGKVLRDSIKSMDCRRLFLSGLRKFTSESSVLKVLSSYAEIENLYLIRRNNSTTNIAYLTLKDKIDIPKLLRANIILDGHKLYIQNYKRKKDEPKNGSNKLGISEKAENNQISKGRKSKSKNQPPGGSQFSSHQLQNNPAIRNNLSGYYD